MTIEMDASNLSVENVTKESQLADSVRFDWKVIALCTWLVLGGYSDAWAHNHLPNRIHLRSSHVLIIVAVLASPAFYLVFC